MTASLRPVQGAPRDVLDLLRPWVHDGGEPLVVRTSGSTGTPKDVVLSHRAVVSSARSSLERLGGPGGWVSAMPVTGIGGLQVLVRSVLAGIDPVIAGEHRDLGSAIRATSGPRRYASLVPTQMHRLLRDGQGDVLAALDAVLVGGAAMPAELRTSAQEAGVSVVRTYGMSETCGGCVYDGLPLDGVRVRIDDLGQVQIAGDVLCDGYGDPAQPGSVLPGSGALEDGWFSTADLGQLDGEGRLRIVGRIDDVVHSGGVNVSLPAVTQALRDLDGVADAVALGRSDPEWGSQVVAFVVPADAVCLDGLRLDAVRDGVQEAGLPRTWAPREVVLLDYLPLLPGGKIDRQALLR